MIKVKVTGVDLEIRKLHNKVLKEHRLPLLLATNNIKQKLVDTTPVDTGFARDHWKVTPSKGSVSITNEADYLRELNAGSSKQAPAHFIERAVLSEPHVKPQGTIVEYLP